MKSEAFSTTVARVGKPCGRCFCLYLSGSRDCCLALLICSWMRVDACFTPTVVLPTRIASVDGLTDRSVTSTGLSWARGAQASAVFSRCWSRMLMLPSLPTERRCRSGEIVLAFVDTAMTLTWLGVGLVAALVGLGRPAA